MESFTGSTITDLNPLSPDFYEDGNMIGQELDEGEQCRPHINVRRRHCCY